LRLNASPETLGGTTAAHISLDLCVWAFDLLHHNGRDLRELPLIERKARLEKVILAANAKLASLLRKL
jgi:ATP-dependent DNA ligase